MEELILVGLVKRDNGIYSYLFESSTYDKMEVNKDEIYSFVKEQNILNMYIDEETDKVKIKWFSIDDIPTYIRMSNKLIKVNGVDKSKVYDVINKKENTPKCVIKADSEQQSDEQQSDEQQSGEQQSGEQEKSSDNETADKEINTEIEKPSNIENCNTADNEVLDTPDTKEVKKSNTLINKIIQIYKKIINVK